jgi:hypothetical protein
MTAAETPNRRKQSSPLPRFSSLTATPHASIASYHAHFPDQRGLPPGIIVQKGK